MRNVLLENLDIRSQKLFTAADVRGFTVRRATVQTTNGRISLLDTRRVLFDRVQFQVPAGALTTTVAGDSSATIEFRRCTPARPTDWPGSQWTPAATKQ